MGLEPQDEVFSRYAGSESCRECHPAIQEAWSVSNHGLAERLPRPDLDRAAFADRPAFVHGGIETRPRAEGENLRIETPGYGNRNRPHDVVRVIGHEPLRQFLVGGEGGRLQAVDAAYDPEEKDWFSVHGDEDRRAGEWGHWTGRGMNWNSMCAACHNTRLRKNYDPEQDIYRTAMAEMSVGCESCHGPMKDHVAWYRKHPDAEEPDRHRLAPGRMLETCASCHSRRSELTGDFRPGEPYDDHHFLVVPDESDLYHADGQVRGENYVYTSFLGSRMHAAGVHCMDCHEPHSTRTILPGNQLCMRCHNGSRPDSPRIDPVAHSRHAPESAGNQCVNCHMPRTTYMQRHPRRDHGFSIPDPLLTRELGIPNACNRCHQDRSTDWAVAATEAWYGERMERYSRERARWIAGGRRGAASAREPLLGMLKGSETPHWKASAARLLSAFLDDAEVRRELVRALSHTNALVRSHAALSLGPLASGGHPGIEEALEERLDDPRRSVRIQAAWALRAREDLPEPAGGDLDLYLRHNSDQPTGQMQLGALALARGRNEEALEHYRRASEWDPGSPPIRHELAIVHSRMGDHREALEQLQEACRLDPQEAEYRFKLALAWNDLGDTDRTIESLEKAVELDSGHSRAWYNLGLARSGKGDAEGAMDALKRGESASPRDPDIPYAMATILHGMGLHSEARAAAARAAGLGHGAATRLLEMLSRSP